MASTSIGHSSMVGNEAPHQFARGGVNGGHGRPHTAGVGPCRTRRESSLRPGCRLKAVAAAECLRIGGEEPAPAH